MSFLFDPLEIAFESFKFSTRLPLSRSEVDEGKYRNVGEEFSSSLRGTLRLKWDRFSHFISSGQVIKIHDVLVKEL